MSGSNCCFLTCIQVSQQTGEVVWYSQLFKNFPQFIMIHAVKGCSVVNEAEVHVFLEFPCFSVIQQMVAFWSLVPLPFLNPTCTSGSSQFTYQSTPTNKARGGDVISAELFQILKEDAVKVLYSICQQIRKTQHWPQDWKRSVFFLILRKGNAKGRSNYHTNAVISHASKVMLKILEASLQQYVNQSCGYCVIKSHWSSKSDSLVIPSLFSRSPGWEALHETQNLQKSERTSLVSLFSRLCVAQAAVKGSNFIMFSPLLPSSCSFFFIFECGVYFLAGSPVFLLSMVVQQLVAILVVSQKMSPHPSTPPSWTGSHISQCHLFLYIILCFVIKYLSSSDIDINSHNDFRK